MGASSHWQAMSLAKMYGDINGGDGYETTAASATMWGEVATQLEDVADRVRALTRGAAADWQGSGADAMSLSHNQFDTWAQDARDLSTAAIQAANIQSTLFTDTRPRIEAPGDASQHQDNLLTRGASFIPGITTDQEHFEQGESDKQKAAAAAMASYDGSVSTQANRGYFSTPPVLAVSVAANPVSPALVAPVGTPHDPNGFQPNPYNGTGSVGVDSPLVATGHPQTGSLATAPASVSAASWQAPLSASAPATSVSHSPAGYSATGSQSAGSPQAPSGGAFTTPRERPATGVSSQGWSDPARTGARGSTGGVPGYGEPLAAGAPGSERSRGGDRSGAAAGSGAAAPSAGAAAAAARSARAAPAAAPSAGAVAAGGAPGGYGATSSAGGISGGGGGTTSSTAAAGVGGGAAGAGGRGAKAAQDSEHEMPDFLKTFELFDDGRLVAPPVIGVLDEDQ